MRRVWRFRTGIGLGLTTTAFGAGLAVLTWFPERLFEDYAAAEARLQALLEAGRAQPFHGSRPETFAAVALVAQEDRRIHHRRFGERSIPWDVRACGRALVRNLTAGRIEEGCSTLAMQLAKLAMPKAPRRSVKAKLMQLRLAGGTADESPDVIVAAYLRAMPCASSFARGLSSCALLRFGRPPEALSAAEVMVLAAAVQAPGRDLQATEAARQRARARLERVLSAAVELGMMPGAQAEEIGAQPLRLAPPNRDLVAASRAGWDLALTQALSSAVAAARLNALRKDPSGDGDLVVTGALYDASGRLRARVGEQGWWTRPVEAGSWVKPFVVAALLEAGVGRDYLSGSVKIPLRVPLVTRDGKPWHPRNAGSVEDLSAVPMEHVMRSINTGTLASLLYAFIYLPPEDSRAILFKYLTPRERRRFGSGLDRTLSLEMASSFAGLALTEDDAPGLPGYRQISLGATRMVLRSMRTRVPELEVPHEDLAALLGVVRASASELAAGLRELWVAHDGTLTDVGRLMAEHGATGTLRWLGKKTPAVYKTATAERNAGLMALLFDRCTGETLQVVLLALRPSGKDITPIQGATLGSVYPQLLSECRRPAPAEARPSSKTDTYVFSQPGP